MDKLGKKIMRGIYYAYALRLVSLPGVIQGFIMIVAMILLTYFVSIGNVLHNLSQVAVGDIGTFIYNAVRTTEVWSLILIGVVVFSLLSVRVSLMPQRQKYFPA